MRLPGLFFYFRNFCRGRCPHRPAGTRYIDRQLCVNRTRLRTRDARPYDGRNHRILAGVEDRFRAAEPVFGKYIGKSAKILPMLLTSL